MSKQNFPLDDEAWESMETILDSSVPPSFTKESKPFKLYKTAGLLCLMVLCYTIYMFSMKTKKAKHNASQETAAIEETIIPEKNQKLTQSEEQAQVSQEGSAVDTDADHQTKLKQTQVQSIIDNPAEKLVKNKKHTYATQETLLTKDVQLVDNLHVMHKPLDNNQATVMSPSSKVFKSTSAGAKTNQLITNNDVKAKVSKLNYLGLHQIPFLEFSENALPAPKVKPVTQTVNVSKRPMLGLYVASQTFDTDRSYVVGLHKRVFFSDKFAMSIEPGYVYRPLEVASIAKDSSEFVSFGASTFEQDIVGHSVHALQIPAFVEYHFSKNFYLATGLSYNRILALGAIKETKIDGVITEEKEIWLDQEFYTNNYYRINFAAGYMLNSHIGLDLQYESPFRKTSLYNEESSIGLKLKFYL